MQPQRPGLRTRLPRHSGAGKPATMDRPSRNGKDKRISSKEDAMLDLLIEGGLVVDGTGAPGRRHAVGVRDGAIVLEPAGADDLARIIAVLHEALAAGGLGFSTSLSTTHSGGDGRPVPSRFAAEDELFAIAEAVGAHPGTTLEMILSGCVSGFQPHEV